MSGDLEHVKIVQWRNRGGGGVRGVGGPWTPNPGKAYDDGKRRTNNWLPDLWNHIVQRVQDDCVRLACKVLPFRKEMFHIQIAFMQLVLSLAAAQEVTRQRKCLHSQRA